MAEETGPNLKQRFVSGAFWVSVLTMGAMVVGFLRSWLLTRFDPSVLGTYAALMMFIHLATGLGVFGGTTTLSQFLPKVADESQKRGLLKSYFVMGSLWWAACLCVLLQTPAVFQFFAGRPLATDETWLFVGLGTAAVFSSMAILNLQGRLAFRSAAMLTNLQPYVVTLVVALAYVGATNVFDQDPTLALSRLILGCNLVVLVLAMVPILRSRLWETPFFVPPGFLSYALVYQFNGLLIFAYANIDRLFVLDRLGLAELGFYFLFAQLATLITFVPKRLGQVMLSSFATLVAQESPDELRRGYMRLCRVVSLFAFLVSLGFVLFAGPISEIFGAAAAQRSDWLILLAIVSNAAVLGNVNTMVVLSREKVRLFAAMNVVMVTLQAVLTWWWIRLGGVEGVILARGTAALFGQVCLFLMVGKLLERPTQAWREYCVSVIMITSLGGMALWWGEFPPVIAGFVAAGASLGYAWLIGFRLREVWELLPAGAQAALKPVICKTKTA